MSPTRSPHRTLLKVIPYAFALPFSSGATMAPSLYVFRYLVCLAWFTKRDPSHLPDGPNDVRCNARDIEAQYTSLIAAFTVLGGITSLVATSAIQRLADRFGRKPFLCGLPLFEGVSIAVLLFAFTLDNPTIIYAIIVANSILSSIATKASFLPTLIIADVAKVEDRTPWYSRMGGAVLLGLGSAMALTSSLTKLTGSIWGPFYISMGIQLATSLYALVVIPETRVQPSHLTEEEVVVAESDHAPTKAKTETGKGRMVEGLLMPLKPLALLLPRKDAETKKRSWTLFLLASTVMMSTFADGFPILALILYMQEHFHFTPGQNGYVLAWLLGTKFFYLVFIFPVILKFGRRAFHRYQLRHPIHQSVTDAPAALDETTPLLAGEDGGATLAEGEVAEEGEVLVVEAPGALANHFDVILAYFSLLLAMVGMLLVSFSSRWEQVVFAFAVLSTAAGFRPSINSTFLACVPPAQASEVLAALEILVAIATTLSSIVLGPVYAFLVKTDHASLLFAVSAALSFLASLFLLPIKRI